MAFGQISTNKNTLQGQVLAAQTATVYYSTASKNTGLGYNVKRGEAGERNTVVSFYESEPIRTNGMTDNSLYGYMTGFKINTGTFNSFFGSRAGYSNIFGSGKSYK